MVAQFRIVSGLDFIIIVIVIIIMSNFLVVLGCLTFFTYCSGDVCLSVSCKLLFIKTNKTVQLHKIQTSNDTHAVVRLL